MLDIDLDAIDIRILGELQRDEIGGGLTGIEEASILVHEKGPRRLSPFFIPGRLMFRMFFGG